MACLFISTGDADNEAPVSMVVSDLELVERRFLAGSPVLACGILLGPSCFVFIIKSSCIATGGEWMQPECWFMAGAYRRMLHPL